MHEDKKDCGTVALLHGLGSSGRLGELNGRSFLCPHMEMQQQECVYTSGVSGGGLHWKQSS